MKNKKILAFMLIAFLVIAPAVGLVSNKAYAYGGNHRGGGWNDGNSVGVGVSVNNGFFGGSNSSFLDQFLFYRVFGCGGLGIGLLGGLTSNSSLGSLLGVCGSSVSSLGLGLGLGIGASILPTGATATAVLPATTL